MGPGQSPDSGTRPPEAEALAFLMLKFSTTTVNKSVSGIPQFHLELYSLCRTAH